MNKQLLNKSSIASVLSTAIIAALTQMEMPDGIRDTLQMATPIASHIVIVFLIWCFLQTRFDTIEGTRERKLREKLRKEIKEDIHELKAALDSGHLTEEAQLEKRNELSGKYKELTNIKVKSS